MDGNNRTVVIDANMHANVNKILSLALDYQNQVLFWVSHNRSASLVTIKRSNIDGKKQQTILQLSGYYSYYYSTGLTVLNETLFLSMSDSQIREVYKLGTNDENFTNSSAQVFCRLRYYQLKVTKQPPG